MLTQKLTLEQISMVAHHFDISVCINTKRKRSASKTAGPRGHAVDVKKRIVYIDELDSNFDDCATILHEIVHVIVHPPWLTSATDYSNEACFLVPFERQLARELLTPRSAAMDGVIDYQSGTGISPAGHIYTDVCHWMRPERSAWWRKSLSWLRQWQALNDDNRVIWHPWQWRTVIKESEWRRAFGEVEALIAATERVRVARGQRMALG